MSTTEVSAHRQQFALVDCNNFYCSCERALNPKLDAVPMVVLSNNDGCAVARSNEVKALGVKMGTPWFQMKDLAKEHGIVAMSSNYTLYGDMSNRVVSILREYSPNIEVYSIDESFVLLNGMQRIWRSPTEMGQHIRHRISDTKTGQGTLFSAYGDDNKRSAALMRTIDSLNQKMGTNTLGSAASGTQKNWVMRSENKSPRYTTCWHELPIAFAR